MTGNPVPSTPPLTAERDTPLAVHDAREGTSQRRESVVRRVMAARMWREVLLLIAGYTDDGMIGADVSADYPRTLHHHLQEDWLHHLRDDPAVMLSWERSWPAYYTADIGKKLHARFAPHAGLTLGNVYTYANAGFIIDLTPANLRWQTQPVRVRPAIPGSGYFEYPDGHGWMAFLGYDARLMARNIFLDGNTWKDSHRVDKRPFVHDIALGAAYNHKNYRISYTVNWRSREFEGPLANSSSFGAVGISYRF